MFILVFLGLFVLSGQIRRWMKPVILSGLDVLYSNRCSQGKLGYFKSKSSRYYSPNPASACISDPEFGCAETGCVIADAPDICVCAGWGFDVCQSGLIVISDAVPAESISTRPIFGSTESFVWRVEPWETCASFIFPPSLSFQRFVSTRPIQVLVLTGGFGKTPISVIFTLVSADKKTPSAWNDKVLTSNSVRIFYCHAKRHYVTANIIDLMIYNSLGWFVYLKPWVKSGKRANIAWGTDLLYLVPRVIKTLIILL